VSLRRSFLEDSGVGGVGGRAHPSRKNKDAARVGHPGSWLECGAPGRKKKMPALVGANAGTVLPLDSSVTETRG